jgi:hypothetical protein
VMGAPFPYWRTMEYLALRLWMQRLTLVLASTHSTPSSLLFSFFLPLSAPGDVRDLSLEPSLISSEIPLLLPHPHRLSFFPEHHRRPSHNSCQDRPHFIGPPRLGHQQIAS